MCHVYIWRFSITALRGLHVALKGSYLSHSSTSLTIISDYRHNKKLSICRI